MCNPNYIHNVVAACFALHIFLKGKGKIGTVSSVGVGVEDWLTDKRVQQKTDVVNTK